jgi:hypothetical protein
MSCRNNAPAICAWAWFQTSCDFISLKAYERVIQNSQYAVEATTGVYSSVVQMLLAKLLLFFFLYSLD